MTPIMEATPNMSNPATEDPISLQTAGTGKSFLHRFLAFDEFIMGRLLKVVYVVGSVAIVLYTVLQFAIAVYAGLYSLSLRFSVEGAFWFLVSLAVVLLASAVALLVLRLYCELMMVIFKIYESLKAANVGAR